MSTSELDDLGPIDIVVIGFPPDAPMTGEAAPLLVDLVERGIIRVLDITFVTKGQDGSFAGFQAQDLEPGRLGSFAVFEGASSGLIGDDDVATAAGALEPGASAVLLIYENTWAAPFASAVRRNGGHLLASERVPVQEFLAALDRADAS